MTKPDDWHLHLRDGEMLGRVLPYTARQFARAIVMPNLPVPVTRVDEALAYRGRILDALPEGLDFEPLMTLYLTTELTPAEIEKAASTPGIVAVKLYPRGATTHSDYGVAGLEGMDAVLEALEGTGLPLLVHGESTRVDCDVFDRERDFLDRTLAPLIAAHPEMKVVFEHITTAEAAQFVAGAPSNVAATLTPQHLLLNRNAIFEGGLRPHHYCLPVLKRERDREALLAAAVSGDSSFFLGTDSAPHTRATKESECGCAGIFSAPIALELYAEAFAEAGAIDRLEAFASQHGPDFYGLPRNTGKVRLEAIEGRGPEEIGSGAESLSVFWAGRPLRYRFAG